MRIAIGAGIVISLFSLSVEANDSAAELAAGGITLVHSDGIVMLDEDLTIALGQVRVGYVFRNDTSAAITTRVAFPLPEWDENAEGDLELDRTSKNPMGFSVTVDGKTMGFETEVKRKAGRVQMTHHWTQTFSPGRSVKVEHRYRPVAGGFFTADARYPSPTVDKQLTQKYCVGSALLAELKKTETYVRTVRYILTSGSNWKGPIRHFKLTLLKATPKERISVCLPDTRKTSPLTFVVERTGFTPNADLGVLFVPDPTPR